MILHETKLQGVFEIHLEPKPDERGFFARCWCQKEFANHGLNPKVVQCSVSFNVHKGTLRGLHYQAAPYPETKVVRCTKGALIGEKNRRPGDGGKPLCAECQILNEIGD